MDIKDIAERMSNLERQTLDAFAKCAQAFDAFDQGAAQIVRSLLAENAGLKAEIERLRGPKLIGFNTGGSRIVDEEGALEDYYPPLPDDEEDIKIGGSE
jgi:hypothetical protein